MEYVHGVDVQQLANRTGQLEMAVACEIVRQAAIGLQHIQENGLVHRDIKPSNLMVAQTGVVKILDLGIARLRSDDEAGTLTAEGGLMGTPDFMAPEQVLEVGRVDIRADIYSLGCTLYRLLSGQVPFDGPDYGTHMAKVIGHTQKDPVPLETVVPDLPPELANVVRKMMEKNPDDRFQTPAEIASAMESWASLDRLKAVAGAPHSLTSRVADSSRNPLISSRSMGHSNGVGPRKQVTLGLIAIALFGIVGFSVKGLAKRGTVPDSAIEPLAKSGGKKLELGAMAHDLTEAVQHIDHNTQAIAETLEQLRDGFVAASQSGQIVPAPRSVGEIYFNARTYAEQGKHELARKSYLQIVPETSFVDIHSNFQRQLIMQEGIARARELYAGIAEPGGENLALQLARASLLEPDQKRDELTTLVERHPDFAPAIYELSNLFSESSQGAQTLAEHRQEHELLQRVRQLHDDGQLLCHYLDQSEAAAIVDDTDKRLARLSGVGDSRADKPVQVSFIKQRRGWMAHVQISEPATDILYAIDDSDFQSTGLQPSIDVRSGKPYPVTTIPLPPSDRPSSIHVKYVDLRGNECGPFELPFDPKDEELQGAKRSLNHVRHTWLEFGEGHNAGRLFFTRLCSYNNVISEVRYGFDTEQPDTTHTLPDTKSGSTKGLYVKHPNSVQFVVVQLVFSDKSKSDVVRIDRQ